jgi:dipeptidyl aminopeptidase/acylaminoacyl peptidase
MFTHPRTTLRTSLAILIFSLAGWAASPSFTLKQVMSAPFPTDLTAAKTGGGIAWVFNAQGARNVWVALPPDYAARQLTNYTEDDGQDVGELAWTPDGKSIVYVRGGDFEFPDASYPNPRAFPQGVEQDVWIISASGGEPVKLGQGHSPSVSPDGKQVAFIYKDQIWSVGISGTPKPAQLIHDEGSDGELRWSPDGSELAFVTRRKEHSLIAVYSFAGPTLHFLDPGVDHDSNPVWSPDGKRIAFIRIPTVQRFFPFGPHRAGPPWSIRVADAATGEGQEIWRAEEGVGSVFRGVVARNQLFWAANDHLIFPWERDGWTHLYSVPAAGGEARLLTPGDFIVEDVTLAPGGRELIFNSNQGDIDRRHLWREALDASEPTELTRGEGIEWSPVEAGDGHTIALLHSDARWPARPALLEAGGEIHDIASNAIPADFPADQLVVPQQVIFSATDGLRIHGQLFLPPDDAQGRHPAVVFFHGGSRRQMLLGWHYMGYYNNSYALNQYLSSRGYVVLSVNYRSGIGYGMKFREAIHYGATGASEFNDVMGAGVFLRSRPDVDAKHIGVWGGSYGGYLTALALARASDLFAAGFDMHGVHDWNLEIPNFFPRYNPEKFKEAARVAFESSPLASVDTWRSPVLIVQGDDDRNVPFVESIHLVEALRKQGVDFRLLVFPDEIHDLLMHRSWVRAYQAGVDFFAEYLGGGK